ncbi:hypothetical protein FO519_008706 [Halicephalobus sp. NKZ332]|nr:hypothetical protein FO519_008706 [Halicephalobus sp. NKZ332]
MSDDDGIGLSNVTWPRSRIPAKVLSDIQTRTKIQATLANLKLKANNDPDSLKLVENLTELLSKVDDENNTVIQSPPQTVNSKSGMGLLKRIRRSTLRNEPYFGSMILYSEPSSKKKSSGSIQIIDGNEGYTMEEQITDAEEDRIPLYAKIIPYFVLFFLTAVYVIFGTFVFQFLDPSLGNRSYHEVFLLPFQTVVTIGWGNLPIITHEGRLFCIFYSFFGVPLALTSLTRIGRLFFPRFTIDWILNSAVLRHHPAKKEKILSFPVFRAFNFLICHLLFGFVLFNGYLGNMGVVKSFYFNYMAIAMIGFGDVSPETINMFQTTFVCLYLLLGAVFLAVLHVALCYHIQRVYFDSEGPVNWASVHQHVVFRRPQVLC